MQSVYFLFRCSVALKYATGYVSWRMGEKVSGETYEIDKEELTVAIRIMRGDAYRIPLDIRQDGQPVTPDVVKEVEVFMGKNLRKCYSENTVLYENGQWYVYMTQQETFGLEDISQVYVRVAYQGEPGDVIGTMAGMITAMETASDEVL